MENCENHSWYPNEYFPQENFCVANTLMFGDFTALK
jgi:hypothetical protein